MYEVWDTGDPPRLITRAAGLDEAHAALDGECRRRHDQAVANGEGVRGMTHRFEIRGGDGPVTWLVYAPDPTGPYASPLSELDEQPEEVTP
ncbi:hypothetical protein [Thermomonospora cellulosilytica]|uniref:Uncharacterized protein n=1 Tax=Thermomonospora cellulosilytica TaxID=1411118 RepID=A0A7W3N1V2_9ACTN|nr:hypothetical protein [Thermomonospora cellulosilytica]MBA9005981.1 hypothetical protein [Thermomonospora cellulosilytica]